MERNILIDILKIVGVVMAGIAILLGSMVKLSWDELNRAGGGEKLRVIPIIFEVEGADGSKIKGEYRIPPAGLLPSSPWYGIKFWRNWLWIKMSPEGVRRVEIMLLVADKSLSEAISLKKAGEDELAKETMVGARKSLLAAREELEKIDSDKRGQLEFRLEQADLAYREVERWEN